MPGETSRLKLKFAEEKDERSSYPTAVDEPRAKLLDEIAVTAVKPSVITTEQSRENTAFGTLTTPDEVEVVLPTNGLVAVGFQALWQSSVSAAGSAALFVGGAQLKTVSTGVPTVQEAITTGTGLNVVTSSVTGFVSSSGPTSFVTTGLLLSAGGSPGGGGPLYFFAAAGTYKLTMQFKASSGKITVKERKLWAWVTP